MFEPLNITLRVLLALLFLFAATKFLTKRSLSNLTYFDYIATALLGTVAGNLAFNINIHIFNFILAFSRWAIDLFENFLPANLPS